MKKINLITGDRKKGLRTSEAKKILLINKLSIIFIEKCK